MITKEQKQNIDQVIEHLHDQAVAKHKENKLEEAFSFYIQSIDLDEIQPEWIYGNSITLSAQIGNYNIGIKLKEKAEKLYPESDEISRAIGILFHKLNDIDKAIEFYLKSITIDLEQPEWVYIKLINLLVQSKLYEQATEIIQKGVKQFPQSEILNKELELNININQNSTNSISNNTSSYINSEKEALLNISESRETPASIENCVDLDISNLRRKLMDSAIIDQYQILLTQMICNIHEGVKEMDVDALVHCLAEIKTDIHYLKTKLLDPPSENVDPQAKQDVNLDKIVSLKKPMPIKCELKERIIGSGWHGPEEHGRWTGPGTLSSIVLPYPVTGKYKFEMIVRSESKLGLLNTLKININDQPLEISVTQTKDTISFPAIVQGEIITSQEQNQSFLAVDLIVEETVNPQKSDSRLIGLLVEKVSLIPNFATVG